MLLINEDLLDKVSRQAGADPRLRMNYNLHESLDAKAQRLLNALEPGTLVPIHRHPHTSETYFLLRGKLRIMFYNDEKIEIESTVLDPVSGNYGIHIPAGQWHSLQVLDSGSVILEVKDGPYMSLGKKDILE